MPINIFQNSRVLRKGFLLPDVMIAVFVVAGALVAILSVMAPTIKAEFFKRDQMIATGLAQEGIEIMRNVRDNNWKKSALAGSVSSAVNAFEAPFPPPGTYCPDHTTTTFASECTMNTSAAFLSQDASGLYNQGGSGKFKRTVQVEINAVKTESIITSTVQWGAGASAHSVVLTDKLTNWGDK